jgi:hypothetical protein
VLVETSEERRAASLSSAHKAADALANDSEISFVLVPADQSRSMQELTFCASGTSRGDRLIEHLTAAFSSDNKTVDISLLQHRANDTLVGSAGLPSSISAETLQQVASQASVETFTLVHPRATNGFTSINIYLDEAGMLKRLPLNSRASEYAARAGFNPPPNFHGDVYLGRIQQKPTLQNISFVLGIDTAFDAPWLRSATTDNLEHQLEMNHITGRTDLQPTVVGSDGTSKQEDGFTWTQTQEELEISIVLPTAAELKQVQVKFLTQSVIVLYQKAELVALKLFERIDVDAATWTIDRATSPPLLLLTMEKEEQALWPRVQD